MGINGDAATYVSAPPPQMAEEISKPLSAAQKVTMVSSGGSEVGASKLAGEVLDIMTKLPATVEKLTGVNIALVNWTICCHSSRKGKKKQNDQF